MGLDEKRSLLAVAFPDQDWSDEQVEAMSEFVQTCVEGGYDEEEEDLEEGSGLGKKPKGMDIVLAFGEPKSKK